MATAMAAEEHLRQMCLRDVHRKELGEVSADDKPKSFTPDSQSQFHEFVRDRAYNWPSSLHDMKDIEKTAVNAI